jgi:hypothetical protein
MGLPRRINTAILTAAVLMPAVLGLFACQKDASFESGGVNHKFSSGETTDTKDFPITIYPQANPIGANQTSGDADDNSRFLMLATSDPVEKVREFYVDALKNGGWVVNETVRQTTLVNLGATKNDSDASVMISANADGKTTISMAVSKKTEGIPKLSGHAFTPDKMNPPTD